MPKSLLSVPGRHHAKSVTEHLILIFQTALERGRVIPIS